MSEEDHTLENLLNNYNTQNNITLYQKDTTSEKSQTVSGGGTISSDEEEQISEFSNIDLPDTLPLREEVPRIATLPSVVKIKRKVVGETGKMISPLIVVSYNIWYNSQHIGSRTREVVKIIMDGHKYLPDVVCLQEVTNKSYKILREGLEEWYMLFEILSQDPQLPYSNLIAIRRETIELVEDSLTAYDFKSQMGRKLMVCSVRHKPTGVMFNLLNIHLESFPENLSYRRDQMESIVQLVKEEKMENFIILGDFNICSADEPIIPKLKIGKDVWVEIGSPESIRFTVDGSSNEFVNGKEMKLRSDRILYNFQNGQIVPTKMKMLGFQEPPSNHYGLLVKFMIRP